MEAMEAASINKQILCHPVPCVLITMRTKSGSLRLAIATHPWGGVDHNGCWGTAEGCFLWR